MASPDTINVAQLARLIGTHDAPAILDVRIDNDHASDPRMLPAGIGAITAPSRPGRVNSPVNLSRLFANAGRN